VKFAGTHALLALSFLLLPLAVRGEVCLGDPEASPGSPSTITHLRAYRAGLRSPTRLAIGVDDTIHVADPRAGEVVARAADGRVRYRMRDLGRPVAIATDRDERLYIGDAVTGAVTVYGPDLQPLFQLGSGAGEFGLPGDIGVHESTGLIFATDSNADSVRVYDAAAGSFLFAFGSSGGEAGQFLFPAGLQVDQSRDEVLVVDQLNYRVQVFDLQGQYKFCIAGSASNPSSPFQGPRFLSVPQGIWVDEAARIYVADSSEGRVSVFDRAGNFLQWIGSFGRGPGQLRIPMDVVIDSSGRLFVSAPNNGRLEVFGLDDFDDPERVAPALVRLSSAVVIWGETESIFADVRVPGYRLADVETGSIAANGVLPTALTQGDFDGDGAPELRAEFDVLALAETLPGEEPSDVLLTASMTLLDVEGSARLQVLGRPDLDEDNDQVPDAEDSCPETAPGAVVDADGCSIAQHCVCNGKQYGHERSGRHGRHVKCVVHRAREFHQAGLIDLDTRKLLIQEAAKSQCDRRLPPHLGRQRQRDAEKNSLQSAWSRWLRRMGLDGDYWGGSQ